MPKFLARLRKRPRVAQGPAEASVAQAAIQNTPAPTPPTLGQKIHANLEELIPPFVEPPPPSPPTATADAPIRDDEDDDGIVPLKPGPRSRGRAPQPVSSSDEPSEIPLPASRSTSIDTASNDTHDAHVHTPHHAAVQSPVPPSSWSTFGRKAVRGAPNTADSASRPPSSSGATSTPASTTDGMADPFTPFGSVSLGSGPSSGFTFGHAHGASPAVAPPMPTLDHPAFAQRVPTPRLPVTLASDHEVAHFFSASQPQPHPQPRPSTSLPSISFSSSHTMSRSSRPRLQDMFSQSPSGSYSHRGTRQRRTRRSKSASLLTRRDGASDEARSTFTYPDTSQARGDSSLASGPFGLGSPFLLQRASAPGSYNLSTSTTDDDNSIPQNNTSLTGMSIDNAGPEPASPSISNLSRSSPGNEPDMSRTPTSQPASSAHPSPALLMPPSLSVTGPTPDSSPVVEPSTPGRSKGKRKADDVEGPGGTPPDAKKVASQKTTFAQDPRPHRVSGNSGSSHAPSSYHRSKRPRISGSTTASSSIAGVMSTVGEAGSRPASRSGSHHQDASNTGSWASRGSAPPRSQSRASGRHKKDRTPSEAPSRRSLSQASIPISALISPHAPSVSHRSTTYHMRDPRKPPPVQSTAWSLSLPEKGSQRWTDGGGSPIHAWMFFVGFVLFPLWWVAALVVPIPRTREIGAGEEEKGVVLDDPQVEHDAISWRRRCRIMAVASLFTYVPFIVCIAIFAPR